MMPTITMTGLDERVSLKWLKDKWRNFIHPAASTFFEFAILRSPKAGQNPRYPIDNVVEEITQAINPDQLAFHLCGGYARMVHSLDWAELCNAVDFSRVRRVQVNSTECDERAMITLQRFSVHIGLPVIMQWRGDEFPCVPGLSLLQDRSGGRGVLESSWARPDALCQKCATSRIGYAGGLGPDNIRDALPMIAAASRGKQFWIDCESSLRTDDWFDQEKADAFIKTVWELVS